MLYNLLSYCWPGQIFYWDLSWVGDYYWTIKRAFHRYIAHHGIEVTEPLFIHSWANCFRSGNIDWHAHAPDDAPQTGIAGVSHFSGTFAVAVPRTNQSATIYKPEGGLLYRGGMRPSKTQMVRNTNTAHDVVIFDSALEHRSTALTTAQIEDLAEHAGSPCRITSSFDIAPWPSAIWHSVPFYDPKDPDWKQAVSKGITPGEDMVQWGEAHLQQWGHAPEAEDNDEFGDVETGTDVGAGEGEEVADAERRSDDEDYDEL